MLKRLDKNYLKTKCDLVPIEKGDSKISKQNNTSSIIPTKKYKESEFINKGPYMTYEEMQRKNEREDKKKWIDKNGFKV